VQCHEDRLDQPLRWKKPRKVFVNSMSDLFHEDVPDAFIDRVFAVMALAPQHTFQILTKRAERMRDYVRSRTAHDGTSLGDVAVIARVNGLRGARRRQPQWVSANELMPWPLPHVWLGVSVENQHFADERIPLLLQTPAAVRFISAEPLLGPINLRRSASPLCPQCRGSGEVVDSESGGFIIGCPCERLAGRRG
jgi:protein gp37